MDLKKLVEKKTTGQAAGDKKKPQASDSHKEDLSDLQLKGRRQVI